MNQANIDSLTARIKVGSLVQILFQTEPIFGLVVAITKGGPDHTRTVGKKEQ